MFKKLRDASDEKNKNMVESINKKLTKLKNIVKNVPRDEVSTVEENEKMIDIVERILELNNEKNRLRLKNTNTKPNASQITEYFSSIKCRK